MTPRLPTMYAEGYAEAGFTEDLGCFAGEDFDRSINNYHPWSEFAPDYRMRHFERSTKYIKENKERRNAYMRERYHKQKERK